MLVRRVELDYLGGQSFDPYKDSDHKFVCVSIRLDKARSRMSGYWKFNSSLLAEDDFRNQLNRWWQLLEIGGGVTLRIALYPLLSTTVGESS